MNDNTNAFAAAPFYLGARGGVMEFSASSFDELSVWKRKLTPAEIAQLAMP